MTMPSSMTRLVEASMNAIAAGSDAPLANRARVVDRAAKLQELEIKPKPVATATPRASCLPMAWRIWPLVITSWMRLLTR